MAAKITIELKPDLYPPEAADAFLGNHVYVEAEEGKWQGVVTAADYLEEDRSVRLTVEAIDVPSEPLQKSAQKERPNPEAEPLSREVQVRPGDPPRHT